MVGVSVQVRGLSELTQNLGGLPAKVRGATVRSMGVAVGMVRDQAKENVMTTFSNPAKMAKTIEGYVDVGGYTVQGRVTASGLPYLAIHEFGGVVHTPAIFPRNVPFALRFEAAGETVFAAHTKAHDTPIPERSYLRRALDQRHADVLALFERLL